MSSTSQNCQAVFLIDTFSEDALDISLQYSRTLALSIFRILCHLSADFPQNTKQKRTKHNLLKWGFKFFDSRLHCLKVEKYSFKEFKLKYFEEFERELLKRIKLVQKNIDAKSSSRKVSKISPSDCLTRSLTELTHDFEWETPDLFSPVKRRKIHEKKGSLSLDTEQPSGNYVFMFTKCPKSAAGLRQFARKRVLDSDVFLDSLMPAYLFSKFCDGLKLKLVWIDTDFKVHDNSFDIQSLKLVEDAIEKITSFSE
ncbi:unnamed protein product [Mytilus coruscus]|uniref:Treslin N-terminal domain-containing protein n=1 Tax=Mytilus coruscus TaxID=42192 RepID=A0A6J8CN52_MYTCO|nr:unnamed protein product [Mytilus coruscus]